MYKAVVQMICSTKVFYVTAFGLAASHIFPEWPRRVQLLHFGGLGIEEAVLVSATVCNRRQPSATFRARPSWQRVAVPM